MTIETMTITQPATNRWKTKWVTVVALLALAVCSVWHGVGSAADILDDSQSPRQTYNIQLQWAHQGDVSALSRQEFQKLIAEVPDVEVRLDTSKYVGQNARIFLVLPVQIGGLSSSDGFTLSWKTKGLFYTGSTIPGNRALIFKGRLDTSQLIDFFTFTLNVDAGRLTGKLRYAPIFEIETF